MGIKTRLHDTMVRMKLLAHSARGKDLLLYAMCVVAAFVFWLFLSLDGEVQRDYELPLKIENMPDKTVALDRWPKDIAVTVQGKGWQFVRYAWGEMPPLKISYKDFAGEEGVFRMSKTKIESRIHDYFGQNVSVLSTRPDSIVVHTTNKPGKRVKVIIDADITPSYQSMISGPITANVDSVTLYSLNRIPASVKSVETMPVKESGLTDTLHIRSVRLKPIPEVRMIPETVDITIPVEPLIAKKKTVTISVINAPADCRIILFPYSVEVSYLVPISKYGTDMQFNAFVNYRDISLESKSVKVHVNSESDLCRSVTFSPESVDYVMEYFNQQ